MAPERHPQTAEQVYTPRTGGRRDRAPATADRARGSRQRAERRESVLILRLCENRWPIFYIERHLYREAFDFWFVWLCPHLIQRSKRGGGTDWRLAQCFVCFAIVHRTFVHAYKTGTHGGKAERLPVTPHPPFTHRASTPDAEPPWQTGTHSSPCRRGSRQATWQSRPAR